MHKILKLPLNKAWRPIRKNSTDVRLLLLAAPRALLPSSERQRQRDTMSLSLPKKIFLIITFALCYFKFNELTTLDVSVPGLAAVLNPTQVNILLVF